MAMKAAFIKIHYIIDEGIDTSFTACTHAYIDTGSSNIVIYNTAHTPTHTNTHTHTHTPVTPTGLMLYSFRVNPFSRATCLMCLLNMSLPVKYRVPK